MVMPDPQQKTFEFDFTLDWKLTMAWYNESTGLGTVVSYNVDQMKYLIKVSDQNLPCDAYADVPPWAADLKGVVVADGKHRRMIMVNGQIPGPTVVVPYGSEIVVRIHNKLAMEGISIHFHGMDKRNEWFMDGVARMQQCPIPAGSDFMYKFTADTVGTHFYHGHLGTDRSEGVFGAVIVVPEDRSIHLQDNTTVIPDVEYSVVLFDWNSNSGTDLWYNHRWRLMKFLYGYENDDECWRPTRMLDGTHIGGSYPMSAVIINDKGWYNQDDVLNRPWKLDMETFAVEEGGKNYLFRLTNAGQALPLIVSIEDHMIEVVSTDGAPIKSVPAQFILLFPGERYDVLLVSKQKADRSVYYMIVETMDYFDWWWNRTDALYALAKIQYRNESAEYKPDVQHTRCTADSVCTVVNCPFPHFPAGYNRTCYNVEKLQYTGTVQKEALQQSYGEDESYEEYFLNFHYDNVMNGWLFEYPKGPPYFHPDNESEVMYSCTKNNWAGVRNSW